MFCDGLTFEIAGCRVECTCGACPEQYDVYHEDRLIGYLRLRHGYFYAAYPDVGGERVYESEPKGDGIFRDDERMDELERAVICLRRADILNEAST